MNFAGGHDHVRYTIDVGDAPGPLAIDVELMYQPIGYRWAHNLERYPAAEDRRFVRYYDEMAHASAIRLARVAASAP